jgi:hypothetical protein
VERGAPGILDWDRLIIQNPNQGLLAALHVAKEDPSYFGAPPGHGAETAHRFLKQAIDDLERQLHTKRLSRRFPQVAPV